MAKVEEYTKAEQQWITETKDRLAQRRGKRPATKAGQLRALWPEIRAAKAEGQSLATIRQWLEEDAGIVVTVQSLGSYLTRIQRKERVTPGRTDSAAGASPFENACFKHEGEDSGQRQENPWVRVPSGTSRRKQTHLSSD